MLLLLRRGRQRRTTTHRSSKNKKLRRRRTMYAHRAIAWLDRGELRMRPQQGEGRRQWTWQRFQAIFLAQRQAVRLPGPVFFTLLFIQIIHWPASQPAIFQSVKMAVTQRLDSQFAVVVVAVRTLCLPVELAALLCSPGDYPPQFWMNTWI